MTQIDVHESKEQSLYGYAKLILLELINSKYHCDESSVMF